MKAAGGEPKYEPTPEDEKDEAGKSGGFFDEEEDETIALTGDELDNILNTAEFSEESPDAEPGEGSAAETEDLLPNPGIIPRTRRGSPGRKSPHIEEMTLASEEEAEPAPEAEEPFPKSSRTTPSPRWRKRGFPP
jgi:hypothetical protein